VLSLYPVPNSRAEADVFDELQTWWQTVTPETQEAIQTGGIVLAALLGGQFLGMMVARTLRAWNFDAAVRLPNSAPSGLEADRNITPTLLVGLLVRLTVWGWAACWLGRQYGQAELASRLGLILNRIWALTTVAVAGLALGSLLARRAVDWLQGSATTAHGTSASQRNVTGAVGVVIYGVIMLLVLLVAADMFDWPLTRSSVLALWQLAQHLLIAGGALFIGSLGARWAREQVTPAATSPEQRAGQYTALGIVSATTVLAVAVLLSSAGLLIGLAVLAVVGFLLWLVRGYLPDVLAGLQLRAQHVREVWFDGIAWQVAEVGFLTSQVTRSGEFHRMQNRLVLEARVHGAPAEAEAESR
jgi:hypothetical protein